MENSNEFKKTDFVFIGGRNNNEFYIFPKDENQFKKEAFEDHQLFVHIIHSDGYTEDHLRKINVPQPFKSNRHEKYFYIVTMFYSIDIIFSK